MFWSVGGTVCTRVVAGFGLLMVASGMSMEPIVGKLSSGSVCVATSFLITLSPSSSSSLSFSFSSSSLHSSLVSITIDPLYLDLFSAVYGRECENDEKSLRRLPPPPPVENRPPVVLFGPS